MTPAKNAAMEIDDGKLALNGIVDAHKKLVLSDANEAKTRMMVIDWMLKRVLGWQDDDISVEEVCSEDGNATFADYLLKTATTQVIVEAKKAGAAFTLPTRMTTGKLGGVLSEGELGKAIRQARDYCRKKSVQFAVVTNGAAWLIFPAVRTDGVVFEDTHARIFRGLEDIQANFVEFWELLSRQRVIEGNLENELLARPKEEAARRGLSLLKEPQFKLNRNSLYPQIEGAVKRAFTDEGIANDPSALDYCYVKTSERVRYDSRLKISLVDTKPPLGHSTVRVRTTKSHKHFDQKISTTASESPRAFLVLGPVGAGKSLFLRYTRAVSAASEIDGKLLWLEVDFKKSTKTDDAKKFIYGELLALIEGDQQFSLGAWKTSVEPAYGSRIAALANGPLFNVKAHDVAAFDQQVSAEIMRERAEVIPYVESILRHALTTRGGYLVIDNVDQIEDDSKQNDIFSEAMAAAHRIGINLIMSLRDSTYIKNKNSPTFDAFQFESIYIDPPSIIPVLSRRFSLARNLLGKQHGEFTLANGFHFRTEDVGAFFDIAASSMLADESGLMFEVLSGGDIRRGLSLAREFLASGHTTADVALHSYFSEKAYRFPIHEVFKGAVLGNKKFYREEDALLPNMLSAKLGSSSLQLLRLQLLNYFVYNSQTAAFEGASVDELAFILQKVGVPHDDVSRSLLTLHTHRVFRTADGSPFSSTVRLVPTRLAAFLLKELLIRFNYVEMCAMDAQIYDDATWSKIVELTSQVQSERDSYSSIAPRIARVRAFLEYLVAIEEHWAVECRRRNLGGPWESLIVKQTLLPALEQDFSAVQSSADRMKVRREGFKTAERPVHKA